MVDYQQPYRADNCNQKAIDVESRDTRSAKGGKEPAANNSADNAKNDI
jgi:hypothetical protein